MFFLRKTTHISTSYCGSMNSSVTIKKLYGLDLTPQTAEHWYPQLQRVDTNINIIQLLRALSKIILPISSYNETPDTIRPIPSYHFPGPKKIPTDMSEFLRGTVHISSHKCYIKEFN